MIYNLRQYLETNIPSVLFVSNGFRPNSPAECVAVIQNSGEAEPWYDRQDVAIQILSRAKTSVVARENIMLVYNQLLHRFGLMLPTTTVRGIVYPAIKTYRFVPNQVPGYLGVDNENGEMWSVNFTTTTTLLQ
jgi:hypothetical protein